MRDFVFAIGIIMIAVLILAALVAICAKVSDFYEKLKNFMNAKDALEMVRVREDRILELEAQLREGGPFR